jgi:hypothetical protein
MFTVIMFCLWLFIGAYNMVLADKISRFSYFICWISLLLYIITASVI